MRRIVNLPTQQIISYFGMRKGFKFFHKGHDLRIINKNKKIKNIVLPENCVFVRDKYQKKWGWTYVFKGLESGFTLKFSHIEERCFIKGQIYNEGFAVGLPAVTQYMIKKKYYLHLHFETWKKMVVRNPMKYYKLMNIKYEAAA